MPYFFPRFPPTFQKGRTYSSRDVVRSTVGISKFMEMYVPILLIRIHKKSVPILQYFVHTLGQVHLKVMYWAG